MADDETSATVVLAAYNHELYLPDAMDSIAAQDFAGLKLIVVDDASSDDSVGVIQRCLLKHGLDATTLFHYENVGTCASLNHALAHVRTPYVAFLSGDDWMEPERFSRQVEALRKSPDSALLYGDVWIADRQGHVPTEKFSDHFAAEWGADYDELLPALLRTNWIPAPSVLCRSKCLREVGGFDEALPYEDYDMWLRLAAHGYSFAFLAEPLVTWRRSGDSHTDLLNRQSDIAKDLLDLQILGKHLGMSRRIDDWLAPRLFHMAVTNFKRGSTSPVITQTLRKCLRVRRTPSGLAYLAAASLRQSRHQGVE